MSLDDAIDRLRRERTRNASQEASAQTSRLARVEELRSAAHAEMLVFLPRILAEVKPHGVVENRATFLTRLGFDTEMLPHLVGRMWRISADLGVTEDGALHTVSRTSIGFTSRSDILRRDGDAWSKRTVLKFDLDGTIGAGAFEAFPSSSSATLPPAGMEYQTSDWALVEGKVVRGHQGSTSSLFEMVAAAIANAD